MRFFVVIVCIVLIIFAVAYSHKQRQKRFIQTISPISEHPDLIGDGAWLTEPTKYPDRFTNYRDAERKGK